MGEPAGIGPELALKVWQSREISKTPPFVLIASKAQMAKCSSQMGFDITCHKVETPAEAVDIFPHALPLLALDEDCEISPGHLDPTAASCITGAIETAVKLASCGQVSAVVTNPIHKKNLYDSGFSFPGHTEFLAHLASSGGNTPRAVMMLQGGGLRTVPVTIHMGLALVPAAVTGELIMQTAEIVHRDLVRCFGLEQPRLVVAGLNPHAGENGALGDEDMAVIKPAVETLKSRGLTIRGPLPADTLFHEAARKTYDVALCMYHDQALIPVKTLGFDRGVNITLGLDFIRTSPDHGTALDIAGQGIADTRSLEEALKCAAQMAVYRQSYFQRTGA